MKYIIEKKNYGKLSQIYIKKKTTHTFQLT